MCYFANTRRAHYLTHICHFLYTGRIFKLQILHLKIAQIYPKNVKYVVFGVQCGKKITPDRNFYTGSARGARDNYEVWLVVVSCKLWREIYCSWFVTAINSLLLGQERTRQILWSQIKRYWIIKFSFNVPKTQEAYKQRKISERQFRMIYQRLFLRILLLELF